MAIEAITQLNGTWSNPLMVEGYVLRDFSIKNALFTSDDDTGLEIILTIRPSLHGEDKAETTW